MDERRFIGNREVLTSAGPVSVRTYRADLGLGGRALPNVVVNVASDSAVGLVVGFSVLSRFDVYVALDEKLIGIFDAGAAPVRADALPLELVTYADGVSYVDAFVPTMAGDAYHDPVPLLIDTGATTTSLPPSVLTGRRPLHTSAAVTVGGDVDSEHFDAGELILGRRHLRVGRIVPSASPHAYGKLGLDVLGRFHVVLSARRQLAWLTPATRRAAQRTHGPGGARCARDGADQPCISVALGSRARPELCATIAPGFGKAPVALDVAAERDDGSAAWGGAIVTLYARPRSGWQTVCEALPVDPRGAGTWAAARLALRWVDRPTSFPCDGRSCLGRGAPLP